ncbi:MAG: sigma-70 family RNA polymerase sigma factor [Kofleriaceae bacterium]
MTALPRAEAETDRDLVASVLAGTREDFRELVRRHNQRLFRATRAVLRNDVDAEDALQQAWLEIYRNLAAFRGEAAFSTWATRIAVNSAIRLQRKSPVLVERDSEPTRPDTIVERAQVGRLLETVLQQLPQGNREVMILRDVLELDTAETAEALGLSEEAVRVRLHRARGAVAAALQELALDHVYEFDGARCDRVTAAVMAVVLE